jgi:peptidoglycan pentaglycine glycine transferase (the first glycine)
MSSRLITTSEISNRSVWEDFIQTQQPHSFLQSWTWGEQYALSECTIFRLATFSGQTLTAVCLLIKIQARRGSFLLCPHGPVISEKAILQETLTALVDGAKKIAKTETCDFIRICPLLPDNEHSQQVFSKLGFKNAPIHMHPELSWMVDITPTEDELLKNMRKTTRYLIRRSESDGISVKMSTDPADMEIFWPVYEETVSRQQFAPYPKDYLRREFELFVSQNQAAFFFGMYKGEVISAAIIVYYGNSGFYHHSGSIQKFEKINASYLVQWEAIKEAKRRGMHYYNFWGIAPENRPKHPWAGLSLFKKGFGGFSESYLHAQDLPLTPKYYLNFAVETLRRRKRGL